MILFLILFLASSFVFAQSETHTPSASDPPSRAVAATANPFATETALYTLQSGGNAVDAAIAAQWALNVVEPQSSGIGGGGFFVYFDVKSGGVYAFDGREKASRRAFPKMFLSPSGDPIPFYPDRITGGLPVGVPGTLRLLKRVHERFGSGNFRFEKLYAPAIQLAEEGSPVSKALAEAIQEEGGRLKRFEASRKIFFHADDTPLKEGEILIQKDLALTFKTLANEGTGAFYEGEIARAMIEAVQQAPFHPGFLELEDLKFYEALEREALHGTYRDYDLFTMGPPSSGGVALIEILNILENFSLSIYGASVESFHLMIEAQKLAFEDRALFLGDPDKVKIPLQKLLSKDYAVEKAREIKFDRARQVDSWVSEASQARPHTSHIVIRDFEGNLVSYTTTIEHVFGSAMVVPGWGFLLNNELTDFDAEPKDREGKPKANALAPEKRPRSSMTPALVFRNGRPLLAVGSPGGSLIIPTVQEVVTNWVDFKMPLKDALAQSRFAGRGGEVDAEPDFLKQAEVIETLERRGHKFISHKPFGNVQALAWDESEGTWVGASDPRGEGEAQGIEP